MKRKPQTVLCSCGDVAFKPHNGKLWCQDCWDELVGGKIPKLTDTGGIGRDRDKGEKSDADYHGGRFNQGEW